MLVIAPRRSWKQSGRASWIPLAGDLEAGGHIVQWWLGRGEWCRQRWSSVGLKKRWWSSESALAVVVQRRGSSSLGSVMG